jgi:hypothetical protein
MDIQDTINISFAFVLLFLGILGLLITIAIEIQMIMFNIKSRNFSEDEWSEYMEKTYNSLSPNDQVRVDLYLETLLTKLDEDDTKAQEK